jgi:tetratricopeptide (TPR) repeat protein
MTSIEKWILKGNSLFNDRKFDEAIQCYDKVLELDPAFKRAWNNKGFALALLGKHGEAIQCYDKALELDQVDADARKALDFLKKLKRRKFIKESKETEKSLKKTGDGLLLD